MLAKLYQKLSRKKAITIVPEREGFESMMSLLEDFVTPLSKDHEYQKAYAYLRDQVRKRSADEQLLYAVYPDPFVLDYRPDQFEVQLDEVAGLYYANWFGKKLYFHRGYESAESVQLACMYLAIEQDKRSPHAYLSHPYTFSDLDILVDAGSAEGNFSLMVIEQVRHVYLFESDPRWIEALELSFAPWRHKVTIVPKRVQDQDNEQGVNLATFFAHIPVTCIKMDIEGAELGAIQAAQSWLRKFKPYLMVATYHRHDDAKQIQLALQEIGYKTSFSKGLMLFIYDQLKAPFFRKVLVFAHR
jgi:hypothetical protein